MHIFKININKMWKIRIHVQKVILGISLIQQAHDKCTTTILHRIIFHLFLLRKIKGSVLNRCHFSFCVYHCTFSGYTINITLKEMAFVYRNTMMQSFIYKIIVSKIQNQIFIPKIQMKSWILKHVNDEKVENYQTSIVIRIYN